MSPNLQNQMDLLNQVIIITGGGRGLGRAMAQVLGNAGATVIVVARSADELAETVAVLTNAGGHATFFQLDVTDELAVVQMVKEVERCFLKVDLLINNAGHPGPIGPIWELEAIDWWRCFDVNLRAPFLCTKAVLPGMIARKNGRIINVASAAGLAAQAYDSAYVTSKTALLRLTENIAAETKEYGVSAFGIDPGTVRTSMSEAVLKSDEMQKWMPWLQDIFDKGRDVPADRAAMLVHFLATGKADKLSGCLISVFDDVEDMLSRSVDIETNGSYTLRLKK